MSSTALHIVSNLAQMLLAVLLIGAVIGCLFSIILNLKYMIQVKVDGKTRVIRDKQISFQTDHDLHCRYKDHNICISEQETGRYYVTVTDKTGMYAVQGGFGGQYCRYGIETIEDCLVMCIQNILL